MKIKLLLLASFTLLAFSSARAQQFELETTNSGVTVKLNGELFTKYVTDQANKPYFYPIIGPTGAHMTRHYPMQDIEGERQDNQHHRGINFGHHKVNGYNTWLERLSLIGKVKDKSPEEAHEILSVMGYTRNSGYKSLKVASDHAVMVVTNDYTDYDGNWIMKD